MRTAEKTNENETASDGERECRAGREERGKRKQKINELRTHEKLGQNKSLNGSKMVLIFSWWRRTPRPTLHCPVRLVPVAVAVPLPHLVAPCCRPAAPLVVKICCAPRRFPRGILKPSSALHLPLSLRVRLCVCECVWLTHSFPPSLSLSVAFFVCVLLCAAWRHLRFYFILYNIIRRLAPPQCCTRHPPSTTPQLLAHPPPFLCLLCHSPHTVLLEAALAPFATVFWQ